MPVYETDHSPAEIPAERWKELYLEAAAEIERLREELAAERERCEKLREALQASQSWLYGHDNTWGQAERRRLNDEALKA